MNQEYETPRLQLKVLNETYATQVLWFCSEGRSTFSRVEPVKPAGFYTAGYQAAILRGEYKSCLMGTYIRYYMFHAAAPDRIIGTVSFSNIQKDPYNSCILGYKLLPEFQGQGYAFEALECLISAIFSENDLHRIEAFVLPDNHASIKLLKRLRFQSEGIARSVIKLKNGFTDHLRYSLINPSHLP